jgi:hypothetical protein
VETGEAGGNKEATGATELVAGGSSFIILFYFVFIINIWIYAIIKTGTIYFLISYD